MSRDKALRALLIRVVAFGVGLLPAFFVVFASVFADVGSVGERVVSLLVVVAVYAVLGALFGWLRGGWQSGLWLGAPAGLLLFWYTFREPQQALLHLVTVALALGAGAGGAYAGARLRR